MTSNPHETLAAFIKKQAVACGFDTVGIVKPEPLEDSVQALAGWVAEGRHGSMKYLEEFHERRSRFLREFGEVRSLIVLGVNYYSRDPAPTAEGMNGRVARYAWGRDYHRVIAEKHAELIDILSREAGPDFRARSCVDTQPVPERSAAIQAGMGFAGKHTGLLNQRYGPWLFLSEIATNWDLPGGEPESGNCGTCSHCQTVCPTGALDQDYRMDARRCISYLTIEHKGFIARDLRPHIKDWLFGCDECLVICPFTSKSKETGWAEFRPEAGTGPFLVIEDLFKIRSNGDYEKKFRGTALLRAGRKQMLRNACLVLGNSGRPEAVPLLLQALQDPAPLVRGHAVWALARLSGPGVREAIEALQAREEDSDVLEEIRAALKDLGPERGQPGPAIVK